MTWLMKPIYYLTNIPYQLIFYFYCLFKKDFHNENNTVVTHYSAFS